MKRYTRPILLVLSLLLFSSCVRYHAGLTKVDKPEVKPMVFPEHFQKALYKTNIHFWKKDFSGLMFFKQNEDTKETRIVFMSEVGLKFFDFKLDKYGVFSVEYILDELNREKLISVLEKDVKLLLQKGYEQTKITYFADASTDEYYIERIKSKSKRLYYSFDSKSKMVDRIDLTGSVFRKIRISLKTKADALPTNISIKHYGLRLQLHLRLIE